MIMVKRNPDIAFTRNPICFDDLRPGMSMQSYSVIVGGRMVYTGRYQSPATIDIAEIAEAYVAGIPSPEGPAVDGSGIFLKVEAGDDFERRLVRAVDDSGNPLMSNFYALPGGISPQNFRRLRELDTDIFAARLLDKRHNFFLTTRTHGWRIVMDEYEVYPLVLVNINDEEDSDIEIQPVGTAYKIHVGVILRGIYAIDINAARKKIAADHGILSSVFNIYYAGYFACQIIIRDTPPERDFSLVKFRNSLGVFELLHLSGQINSGAVPNASDPEARSFDRVIGRYVNFRQRTAATMSLEINTGFKTEEEIRFIMDMVCSDEVYLKDQTGWVRAIPSIDDCNTQNPHVKPESLKISFTVAEEYDNLTPDIKDLKDFERPRIFSDQHTDQFN